MTATPSPLQGVVVLAGFAHPDDESFGPGGTIAGLSARGARVHLLTATRGERSTVASSTRYGPRLGRVRERELACAVRVLGVSSWRILGHPDGAVDRVAPQELEAPFAEAMERLRPHIVITFHPGGVTGHPDHRAVALAVTSAFRRILEPLGATLYYWAVPASVALHIERTTGVGFAGVPDEEITTVVDVRPYLEVQRRAIACHRSQSEPMPAVPRERLRAQAGREFFLRLGPDRDALLTG